jgi:hypothetical protein
MEQKGLVTKLKNEEENQFYIHITKKRKGIKLQDEYPWRFRGASILIKDRAG